MKTLNADMTYMNNPTLPVHCRQELKTQLVQTDIDRQTLRTQLSDTHEVGATRPPCPGAAYA